jgi:FkbM family methyltransferase
MKLGQNPHEEDFRAISLFPSSSEQTFIDIGSNRGQAITSMLMMSKPEIKIIGFEPNPLIYTKLKTHFKSDDRVLVHNLGLANENDQFNLFVPFYRKWMFDGLSSFEYKSARSWLKSRLWLYNDKKLNIKEIKCETKRLDEFNLSPYFIKIDVEGYELEVIKGGIETIKAHTPILLIEAINEETKRILSELGYQFYNYTNGAFCEGTGDPNTFCMNKEKYAELTNSQSVSEEKILSPKHAHA